MVEWCYGRIQALSERPTGFLQCSDTDASVIWPVKIVPKMTYNVLSGTLSLILLHLSVSWPRKVFESGGQIEMIAPRTAKGRAGVSAGRGDLLPQRESEGIIPENFAIFFCAKWGIWGQNCTLFWLKTKSNFDPKFCEWFSNGSLKICNGKLYSSNILLLMCSAREYRYIYTNVSLMCASASCRWLAPAKWTTWFWMLLKQLANQPLLMSKVCLIYFWIFISC